MKLNILAIAAHPDDVELSSAGTLIKHKKMGYSVGIIDLTKGELGTRGTAAIRKDESTVASKILGLDVRENIGLRDGFISSDEKSLLKLISLIRKYKPDIILANAIRDRHPDHSAAASFIKQAAFLSGLMKIKTPQKEEAWRPSYLYHYIQDDYIEPDFAIDISNEMDLKLKAIRAFRSQFFDPSSVEPQTYISTPDFLETVQSRSQLLGKYIGVKYAEGFTKTKLIGIKNLYDLL